MIVSLGGSPEPLIKTLSEHRPQFVCFLASHASIDLVGQVKDAVKAIGINFHDDHKVLVENINELSHCYQKALVCADWVAQKGVPAEDVTVDYTGGTKTMTAALVLATVSRGFGFSYVGGSQRTKSGLGVVESGSEKIYAGENPWHLFAVQERQRLAQYFNVYQFAACRTLIQEVVDRLARDERRRFETFLTLVEGYEAWDRFNHRRGLRRLDEAAAKLQQLADLKAEGFLSSLTAGLASNLEFLRRLQQETHGFQDLHPLMLSDLLANAKRRTEEGKFDDAAARLYRLVEMTAQIEVQRLTQAKTENFPPEKIPPSLREEFVRRYRSDRDGQIKLGLEASYQLLQEKGNEIGQQFFQDRGRFDRLQQARNRSILAHGVVPIEEERARELVNFASSLVPLRDEPRFPKLLIEQ
jgi:CRISPR-associated protein (TIGR02710 family)